MAIATETCNVPVGDDSESIDGTAEDAFFNSGGDAVGGLDR